MAAPISITAPMIPGSAGATGKAVGALAGFDALMNAFFASAEGVLQAGQSPTGPAPAMTDPAPGAQTMLEQVETALPADATTAPLVDPAKTAPDASPKLLIPVGKILGRNGDRLLASVAAQRPAQPSPAPAAQAANAASAAIDATAIIGAPKAATDETTEAAETPPTADQPAQAQVAAVMALLAPTPAPPPAPAKSEAPPAPAGSSPLQAEAPPLPAVPAAEPPAAEPPAAAPKFELLADKAADAPTPSAAPAAKSETVKAANAPAADPPPPPPTPIETAPAQAATAPPPPVAPVAEKPARPERAAREGASRDSAATPTATAPRPGPAAAVTAAAPSADTNKNSDQNPAAGGAEPQLAETSPRTADPQPAAGSPPPPAAAANATHAAAAAAVRGAPETVANLAAQIVKKLGARSSQFDLQLDPAGLGKVNVRIEINADGRLSAAMSFDNPQAAAELRSRANELQRALAQSGFDLTGGLSFDVAQDQGGNAFGQHNAFQNNDNPRQAFRGRAFAAALETAGDAAQAALIDRRATPSGVDVRI